MARDVKRLAERVRRKEAELADTRRALNAAILEAHAGGQSLSSIAREAGVSRQWVAQIVERGEEA